MEQKAQNQPVQEQQPQREFNLTDYLKNQIKYLGFGEKPELHQALLDGMASEDKKFKLYTTSDKVQEGNKVDFILNFNKSDKGGVFFNSYKANLITAHGEERSHSFGTNHFTAKEAINLLEGRAVKTEFHNNKTNQDEEVFVTLDFSAPKNEFDNYKMQIFNKNYGVNVKDIVEKSALVFDNTQNIAEVKDMVIKSLEKGNIVSVKFKNNNETIEGNAVINPQYKTLNLYDSQMNRINTNKPIQGLENDKHEKNNAREQSVKRSMG